MSVAEYEKKYTELAKYAMVVIADETDRCKRFEEGLQKEIRTPVIASVEWSDFAKLVEAAMRVEKSIAKEKAEKEVHRGGRSGQPSGMFPELFGQGEGR